MRLAGACIAVLVFFRPLPACHVFRTFPELYSDATDVLVARTIRVDGDPGCYCQTAVLIVERSFKNKVRTDLVELPFVYQEVPMDQGDRRTMSLSSAVEVKFEEGKRYRIFLEKSPAGALEHSAHNGAEAQTEYRVLRYPEHVLVEVNGPADPAIRAVEALAVGGQL